MGDRTSMKQDLETTKNRSGLVLRPLRELDAEIEQLKLYQRKLIKTRELRFDVARLQAAEGDVGLVEIIAEIACAVRKCEKARLYAGTRAQFECETRWIVFYVARQHTSLSQEVIGEHFKMDHGSVLNGERRAKDLKATDTRFAAQLARVESLFIEHMEKSLEQKPTTQPCQ